MQHPDHLKAGFPPEQSASPNDTSNIDVTNSPQFRQVPNRWIIVRRLHPGYQPSTAKVDTIKAWVVLSDAIRNLNGIDLERDEKRATKAPNGTVPVVEDLDLELDVSPFLNANASSSDKLLQAQAEVFLGRKISLEEWEKPEFNDEKLEKVKLTTMCKCHS
jgi:hypothetical protein